MKLRPRYVAKPWGRTKLPPNFATREDQRTGEIWFDAPEEQRLLIKYIFTSERLSIQVHPNDAQARERGLPRGKNECWFILDAEHDSVLALGLTHEVSREELHSAAVDGTIEQLMKWRSVRAGDVFMVPAGTIHAIGGGVSLLEVQQNSDVTYRLYDYGRPRELHLDDGIAIARRSPYPEPLATHALPDDERTLVDCPQFVLVQSHRDQLQDRSRWIMPLEGQICANGVRAGAGECLYVEPGDRVDGTARLLIATTPQPS
jgi:mannose-6-phosphate isomerase